MLKRNLIAIAIVTLGLVMTINTFGQDRPPVSKKDKPKRSDAQIKLMYVANQEEYMAGGIADVRGGTRDRGEETARTKQNNGFVSPSSDPHGIKVPQPKGMNKADLTEQLSIKSPRDAASGQATGVQSAREAGSGMATGIVEVYEGKGGLAVKSAREAGSGMATGKRQHLPVKSKNLGDTGTHEVGHKQRKRGNN